MTNDKSCVLSFIEKSATMSGTLCAMQRTAVAAPPVMINHSRRVVLTISPAITRCVAYRVRDWRGLLALPSWVRPKGQRFTSYASIASVIAVSSTSSSDPSRQPSSASARRHHSVRPPPRHTMRRRLLRSCAIAGLQLRPVPMPAPTLRPGSCIRWPRASERPRRADCRRCSRYRLPDIHSGRRSYAAKLAAKRWSPSYPQCGSESACVTKAVYSNKFGAGEACVLTGSAKVDLPRKPDQRCVASARRMCARPEQAFHSDRQGTGDTITTHELRPPSYAPR
jgi:hypothetical protein